MPDHVEIIGAAFEALAAHDVEAALRCFDPEVVVEPARGGPPLGRTERPLEGRDAVRAWFTKVTADWTFFRATLLEAREYAPGVVVAEGTLVANPPQGAGFGSFCAWIFTFSGGCVQRMETFLSREALADALTSRGVG
jgi:ketosteroid isomerase-like protein